MKVKISGAGALDGFRYFWMKRVDAFDPRWHCARCMVGEYVKNVGATMACGEEHEIPAEPGQLFYLCGVSTPYAYRNNFHLALRVKAGAEARARLWNGRDVVVYGAEPVAFDDTKARELYQERTEAYLSCRNFQFGAHVFK